MQSDIAHFKNKGCHFNMFFFIYHVTGGFLYLWNCAHCKYILFKPANKHCYTFLVASYVFYCFVPMNVKIYVTFP